MGRAGLVAARDHMLYPMPDKAAPLPRKKKDRRQTVGWTAVSGSRSLMQRRLGARALACLVPVSGNAGVELGRCHHAIENIVF